MKTADTIECIALDIARSCGVAVLYKNNVVKVTTIVGTPQQQLSALIDLIGENKNFTLAIEKLTYFRNANTIRSLLERSGYLKFSLIEKYEISSVHGISATNARKSMKLKSKKGVLNFFKKFYKKINDDESDALALLWSLGLIDKSTKYERFD